MRIGFLWLALLAWQAAAAERKFDFGDGSNPKPPAWFRSVVTGEGKPGDWRVILDDVPPMLPPLTPQAPSVTKRPVLAQLARDPTDDHFPLLVCEDEVYKDFKLTTRFKVVSGDKEQMAGLAFRIQDERNYYYVRASVLGKTFYFFKFVNGELIGPIGSKIDVAAGGWHEMAVECKGSQVTCYLDGKAVIPQMQQDTFAKGKIGFWTKSDSVSYFSDARIEYEPLEPPAQKLVKAAMQKYGRLLGIQIYVRGTQAGATRLIGSQDPAEIGQAGGANEMDVIDHSSTYYAKGKGSVSVIRPLRDRNGDSIAAVRVTMKTFPGQTESNAIVRATPVVQTIQAQVQSLDDLLD